ncbi:MAG: hypothetical protein AB7G08_27055 [Hyphomicrobiaceae bacterium]
MRTDQQSLSDVGDIGGNSTEARIISHLARRVTEARLETWPFQHIFVENIFPDDVYRQIVANLPDKSSYLPFNVNRWKNEQGESTRDRLCLSEGELDRIEGGKRPFWSILTRALESTQLRLAVYAKLSEDIALRLGCSPGAVTEQAAYPNVMLIRDYKDYRIKPHPDGQPRVVTMQFYLPSPGTPDNLGTSLYVRLPLARRLLGRKFKEVKRFPFQPNSAYAIAVNDCSQRQSYHGRELITATQTTRDSIIIAWLSRNVPLGQKHVM